MTTPQAGLAHQVRDKTHYADDDTLAYIRELETRVSKRDDSLRDIKDIVTAYLRGNGYDGLASRKCGCDIDDLMPCNAPCAHECRPAKAVKCDGTCTGCESHTGTCYRAAEV